VVNQNQVYINGQFVDAITAERVDVIDPATSDVIARVPNAGRADVQKAAASARASAKTGKTWLNRRWRLQSATLR
jgi:acyl-CoA reductase-like NAD-dependent aldehyde dehydrogenase